MPVEAVELVKGHEVEEFLYLVASKEMARGVEMEASPTEPWGIFYLTEGQTLCERIEHQHLIERGDRGHDTTIIGTNEFDTRGGDLQLVAILSQPLLQR